MNDVFMEILAICTIILGLVIGYFFVLDFSEKDAYFIISDNNAFIDGSIMTYSYDSEKNWSYMEIYSCKIFSAGMRGNLHLHEGDLVKIKGSYSNNFFFIDELIIN